MASNYNKTIETATEEFDSLENVSGCTKNPGHEHFYSVADLNYDILPVEWRNEQCLTYIRNISKLVVKLTVNKADGTKMYGTGYVIQISGIFYIITNEHVISKQEDVERCKIEFFFDTEDRIGIETSYGVQLLKAWKKQDVCAFTLNPVPQAIKQLVSAMSIDSPPVGKTLDIVVISHPHGCRKTITIGEILGIEGDEDDDCRQVIQTARTCPGSSGGLVFDRLLIYDTSQNSWPLNTGTHFAGKTGDVYHGKHAEGDAYTLNTETGNINYCTW